MICRISHWSFFNTYLMNKCHGKYKLYLCLIWNFKILEVSNDLLYQELFVLQRVQTSKSRVCFRSLSLVFWFWIIFVNFCCMVISTKYLFEFSWVDCVLSRNRQRGRLLRILSWRISWKVVKSWRLKMKDFGSYTSISRKKNSKWSGMFN